MNDIDTETENLGWELIGWDDNEQAAHVVRLTRAEILRIRDLFPERDDELLETAAYEVKPARYSALRSAIPHLKFSDGLEYQVGGFLLSP